MAAELGVGWVATHRQGTPATMQREPRYDDVVAEVRRFLADRAARAAAAGVREVWVDPGIGFGKTRAQPPLLEHLGGLAGDAVASGPGCCSAPVASGSCGLRGPGRGHGGARQRTEASLATAVWAMARGAGMVRVHDVAPTVQAAVLVGPSPDPGRTDAPVAP